MRLSPPSSDRMLKTAPGGVLASLGGLDVPQQRYASPPRHCRLTVSPAPDVALFIHRAVHLAAVLPDNRFEHPVLLPAAENGPQRRSRVETILNVPEGYASDSFFPAALPGTRRVLARRGWAGKKVAILSCRVSPLPVPDSRFEHPVALSTAEVRREAYLVQCGARLPRLTLSNDPYARLYSSISSLRLTIPRFS